MKVDEVVRRGRPEPEPARLGDAVSLVLARILPALTPADLGRDWSALGLDSFDLLTLRLAVEEALGGEIEDGDWIRATTPARLSGLALRPAHRDKDRSAPGLSAEETVALGMPQMAMGGLSESWLLKHLGDLHWRLVGRALDMPPSEIKDSLGNRLYPTFTRVRFAASSPLARFEEGERLCFRASLSRFGAGIFFADILVQGEAGRSIEAQLMSSFAHRGGAGNRALRRAQPVLPGLCAAAALPEMPQFGRVYHQRRRARNAARPVLGRCGYQLVPHYDINGVGLLYYAAYPMIADACHMRVSGAGAAAAMETSIVERDIFYFANADAGAALEWRLHRDEKRASLSSIVRDDGIVMALVAGRKVAA
ncbi:MAG TPA: LnmK family bifunctional acyltransferase/decarboxylase [Allosphingosinicella sp.]|nr:LnmK family bifunctional acyltransferase/decarboxylase [Allosphingosinicella sp.]